MKSFQERLERIEIEESLQVSNVDGSKRTIKVKVPALRDPRDGEIYFDADGIAARDKAKARHMGVLAPQELADLRERLGLTQSEIAELLQIGEKSWSRWENGREIVSRSLNLLLLALYEGKIDVAYLRSKIPNGSAPMADPVLRTQGWENLARAEARLPWKTDLALDARLRVILAHYHEARQVSGFIRSVSSVNWTSGTRSPVPGASQAAKDENQAKLLPFELHAA